ncbi:hypothetical protein F2Q70_00044397 [Brassica cretica]|uniref:Uncharacterized protein n=1 Tax=Brassica cretica TaxID=69181 RepID=A0A8S9KF51_BRACR|nr:hypothetical protein F2Q70_00044397 [Brassica cretica]KAF2606191.1 hypothetical protein F2Q68_00045349 [Brassica cretica]
MVSEPGSSEPELQLPQSTCSHLSSNQSLEDMFIRAQILQEEEVCMERLSNPASNRLVQEVFSHPVSKWCPRRWRLEDMKQGRAFEYEKQDGGHELKEKEVGDDPNSQIQQKLWPVSQNAKGINLVPCCSQDVFLAQHLSKTRGRLDPLCGAMGRYLCVEAGLRSACHISWFKKRRPRGLRSAGHEVVELLVQDTHEEEGHHLSHEEGRSLRLISSLNLYSIQACGGDSNEQPEEPKFKTGFLLIITRE